MLLFESYVSVMLIIWAICRISAIIMLESAGKPNAEKITCDFNTVEKSVACMAHCMTSRPHTFARSGDTSLKHPTMSRTIARGHRPPNERASLIKTSRESGFNGSDMSEMVFVQSRVMWRTSMPVLKDRTSAVTGKSGTVRVDLDGGRII